MTTRSYPNRVDAADTDKASCVAMVVLLVLQATLRHTVITLAVKERVHERGAQIFETIVHQEEATTESTLSASILVWSQNVEN